MTWAGLDCRAVDQDGELVDVFLQAKRDVAAAGVYLIDYLIVIGRGYR